MTSTASPSPAPGPDPSAKSFIQTARIGRHVGIVTFDRPQARNAVNLQLAAEFNAYLEWFEADPEMRVGILTGNGRVFCAGGDVKEPPTDRATQGGFAGFTQMRRTKPWIACLQGPAHGGGAELALACELIVMADHASMVWPGVRHGLPWRGLGPVYASRKLPPVLFNELLLTGAPLTAQRAMQHGMVNSVVPAGEVLQEAIRLAQQIAQSPPVAVRKCLAFARAAGGLTLEATFRLTDDS